MIHDYVIRAEQISARANDRRTEARDIFLGAPLPACGNARPRFRPAMPTNCALAMPGWHSRKS